MDLKNLDHISEVVKKAFKGKEVYVEDLRNINSPRKFLSKTIDNPEVVKSAQPD